VGGGDYFAACMVLFFQPMLCRGYSQAEFLDPDSLVQYPEP